MGCSADKPETIDALKNNIREAVGEIQLHTIDNVIKLENVNWFGKKLVHVIASLLYFQ